MCIVANQVRPMQAKSVRTFAILQVPTANEKGIVRVRMEGRCVDHVFDLSRDGDEIVVYLKRIKPASRTAQQVMIARDGSAMCHCHDHFENGHCWHADLAVALVRRMEALETKAAAATVPAMPIPAVAPVVAVRESTTTIRVVRADGRELAAISCEAGINEQHVRIAEWIAREPKHLAYPQSIAASLSYIPQTTVDVIPLDGPALTVESAKDTLRKIVRDADRELILEIKSQLAAA